MRICWRLILLYRPVLGPMAGQVRPSRAVFLAVDLDSRRIIKDGTGISPMRDTQIFGPGFAGGLKADPIAAAAALPPEAKICGCKGKIVRAIEGGATTPDAVRAQTKANSSFWNWTGRVEQVLAMPSSCLRRSRRENAPTIHMTTCAGSSSRWCRSQSRR